MWFVLLPEAQEAPPKECKQLHAVELVRLEVLKSLKPCFETLCGTTEPRKSQKMNKQKCPSKTLDFVTSKAK